MISYQKVHSIKAKNAHSINDHPKCWRENKLYVGKNKRHDIWIDQNPNNKNKYKINVHMPKVIAFLVASLFSLFLKLHLKSELRLTLFFKWNYSCLLSPYLRYNSRLLKDLGESGPIFWIAILSYLYFFALKIFCSIFCKSVIFSAFSFLVYKISIKHFPVCGKVFSDWRLWAFTCKVPYQRAHVIQIKQHGRI